MVASIQRAHEYYQDGATVVVAGDFNANVLKRTTRPYDAANRRWLRLRDQLGIQVRAHQGA